MSGLKLIVGLGNPGPRYERTRHNVGANFVWSLGRRYGVALNEDGRFKGYLGRGAVAGHEIRLLIPTTFMNLSGESVGAVARFYKLPAETLLVAYDEMAFEPGVVRLKTGGGDNGHNGVRSVIEGLGNNRGFHRLRIGVGHPGNREEVTAFLTSRRMPSDERAEVEEACDFEDAVLAELITGNLQNAMNRIHAPG